MSSKQKTTKRYPITRQEAEAAIRRAAREFGPNRAHGSLSYRGGPMPGSEAYGPPGGLVAFSYVESPRTPGAFRQIPYAS